MESIQYNAALAITDSTKRFSREKFHQDIGILQQQRWCRSLCYFLNQLKLNVTSMCSIKHPPLGEYIKQEILTLLNLMLNLIFRAPFFSSTVTEWNNLDKSVGNSEKRLRLGLNHLNDHKFKHSFKDLLNPFCNFETDVKTTVDYLIRSPDL